jgi:Ca2+:H+ antiporter
MNAVVVGEQNAHGLGQDRVLEVSARASEAPRFSKADLISFGVAGAASVVALVLEEAGASGAVVFVAAAVSVMALAYVLGEATEQAGTASGPRLAALLNATFGNLPELIIVVLTVREGLVDVARASIIGSVVGNVLLVLGASILLGGLRNGPMKFDQASAGMNASMLTLAAVALGIPSLFDALHDTTRHEQVALSYGTAVIMVIVYVAYLVYSLTQPGEQSHHGEGRWSARTAMLTLAVTALVTGAMSELLVSAIEPTIKEIGIGTVFIGMVVVPLVGNVPEHWAAVRIARAGNLDFSMGIAFNSGLQVALAGTAIAVAAGALLGNEVLIVFPPIELALLAAATIMTAILTATGKANWLQGLQLLAIYVVAALAFWYL